MGKTIETKPYLVNLRSPLPRIHYYQSQVVTSIRNLTKPFGLTHQLEEDVGYKFLQFINNKDQEAPWSQNPWRKDAVPSSKRRMN